MIEDKVDIACKVFNSIKENWLKAGDFKSLCEIICSSLELTLTDEIKEKLIKANALWLNNHLDEPLEDDPEAEAKEEVKEKKEEAKVVRRESKNHDFH